ncbi:8333_t:CDS:2, partial [Funneliformis geosporum]
MPRYLRSDASLSPEVIRKIMDAKSGSDNQSLDNPNITSLPQNNILEDTSLECNTAPDSKKKKTGGKKQSQGGQ